MASETTKPKTREKSLNFLEEIIESRSPRRETRTDPASRPSRTATCISDYAKSICINFGLAKKYGGRCNLRFDDTNPVKEMSSMSIRSSATSSGWASSGPRHHASDYFDPALRMGPGLIRKGLAYVDDQTQEADPREPRHGLRAGHPFAVARPLGRGGTSTCSYA